MRPAGGVTVSGVVVGHVLPRDENVVEHAWISLFKKQGFWIVLTISLEYLLYESSYLILIGKRCFESQPARLTVSFDPIIASLITNTYVLVCLLNVKPF